jgi:hypothetical protein
MVRHLKNPGLGLIIAALVLAAGCAAIGSHFRRSGDVADTFENYQLIPGHDYYISGRDTKPVAIVALREDYSLTSPHWRQVHPDSDRLRQWVERMLMQPGAEFNQEPNGARILDQQGNPIGVWYSVWQTPILRFQSDKGVTISQPMTVFPETNRNRGNDGETNAWAR